jgi:hypothetical protein
LCIVIRNTIYYIIQYLSYPGKSDCIIFNMSVLDSRREFRFRQVWKKKFCFPYTYTYTRPCQLIWWSHKKKKNLTRYLDIMWKVMSRQAKGNGNGIVMALQTSNAYISKKKSFSNLSTRYILNLIRSYYIVFFVTSESEMRVKVSCASSKINNF